MVQTQLGEIVKSKGERRIADYFTRNNIRYEYERVVPRIGRPDFYLPDYGVVVEYWGLIDADDKQVQSNYKKNMRWKMAQYHSKDIKFVSIYPLDLQNLDYDFKRKLHQVLNS
jgi:DNA helicase-4